MNLTLRPRVVPMLYSRHRRSTQSVAENICPGPDIGSSDITPHHVGWEPLVTYGQKPSGPPFKVKCMFGVLIRVALGSIQYFFEYMVLF